ncbi:MAG: response regulator transcription factor [Bacteroidota bacterium]
MIKLIVIEDNKVLRERLINLIKQSQKLTFVAAFSSMESFLKSAATLTAPNVVLLDIGLPGISGIAGIPRIKNIFPEVEIVILTAHNNPEKIFKAICVGATGYLLKDIDFNYLESELVALHEREGSPLSPQVARRVLNYFQKSKIVKNPDSIKLRDKEYIIVKALVDGLSYEEVAEQVGMTIDGVRYHIKKIYKKLEVNSKAQVIKKYLDGEIDGTFS